MPYIVGIHATRENTNDRIVGIWKDLSTASKYKDKYATRDEYVYLYEIELNNEYSEDVWYNQEDISTSRENELWQAEQDKRKRDEELQKQKEDHIKDQLWQAHSLLSEIKLERFHGEHEDVWNFVGDLFYEIKSYIDFDNPYWSSKEAACLRRLESYSKCLNNIASKVTGSRERDFNAFMHTIQNVLSIVSCHPRCSISPNIFANDVCMKI